MDGLPSPEVVLRVAQAIYDDAGPGWDRLDADDREWYMDMAVRAITVYRTAIEAQ